MWRIETWVSLGCYSPKSSSLLYGNTSYMGLPTYRDRLYAAVVRERYRAKSVAHTKAWKHWRRSK